MFDIEYQISTRLIFDIETLLKNLIKKVVSLALNLNVTLGDFLI